MATVFSVCESYVELVKTTLFEAVCYSNRIHELDLLNSQTAYPLEYDVMRRILVELSNKTWAELSPKVSFIRNSVVQGPNGANAQSMKAHAYRIRSTYTGIPRNTVVSDKVLSVYLNFGAQNIMTGVNNVWEGMN